MIQDVLRLLRNNGRLTCEVVGESDAAGERNVLVTAEFEVLAAQVILIKMYDDFIVVFVNLNQLGC